jgi:hypothetical protein
MKDSFVKKNRAAANGGQGGIFAHLRVGLAAAAILLVPCLARAQYVPDYFPAGVPGYDRDIGVTVVTRVRPLYEEPGVRAGIFTLLPTLNESTDYNSNVLGLRGGPGSGFPRPTRACRSGPIGRATRSASRSAWTTSSIPRPETESNELAGGDRRRLHDWPHRLTLAYAHLSLNERPTDIGAPPSSTPIPVNVDDVRSDYTFDLGGSRPSSWWRFGAQLRWPTTWRPRFDSGQASDRGPLWRTARPIVLRSGAPPSSPAPSAHRCAAAGLDRDAPAERLALVPSTP